MRCRIEDDGPARDQPCQRYWSAPPQSVVGGGPQRIVWTHPQLVEERMLAMGATGIRTLTLGATTWLARLSAHAVAAAHPHTALRREVSVS